MLIDFMEVTIENLEFSPLERKIYDSMYTDAKKNFDRLSAKGLIGKNYTHILAMLMRFVHLFCQSPYCLIPSHQLAARRSSSKSRALL